MSETEIFQHEQFGEVRIVTIEGEPWFVGKDVAEALGYSDTAKAVRNHVSSGQRRSSRIGVTGAVSEQVMTVLSEAGVWRLVMRSNKPEAVKFQDWLAEDVIPAIRKTGRYAIQNKSRSEALRELGREILAHAETAAELESVKPRAELMQLFEDTHGLDIGAVGSLFGYKAHQFHEMMRSWGATYYDHAGFIQPSEYWLDMEWVARRKTGTTIVLPGGVQAIENILGRQVIGGPRRKEIRK